MTLVKYNPSSPSRGGWMDDFFSSSLFPNFDWGRTSATNTPAVNIRENPDNYELEVAAPRLNKKDFEVSVENGLLTISGHKETQSEENNNHFTRREFSYNSFKRSFSLPEDVKQDEVVAVYQNGILHVTLPKSEQAKAKAPRTIKIS
ncbi:Hsp20/alpha crystallin family protein [Solitalea sp. MAHUQ-68]|uniref:Hsp20/alpha crystallin family protein n=1 Tax=Solitalea agri TaxID=2953739 RepID=A0A9X2F1T5_9SPHI|nr:Hsp20/alpha crystallin family protein [Solitalea agri]MCO4292534.1 Hsp20/alpha crystallin family protein [Solitalea agri]